MKKFLALVVLILIVYIVLHRQRLFVRDPLASVVRDGTKEAGTQVFINYSNDVLLENDNAPAYILILQHGGHIGTPALLKCIHWAVCLTDNDMASLLTAGSADQVHFVDDKTVEFSDAQQHAVKVTLR